MGVPFDHIKSDSHSTVENSLVLQLHRTFVWKYIESMMPQLKGFEMLELSMIAPDEMDFFNEKGLSLMATDVGEETMRLTHQKSSQFSMQNRISSHYLDVESFDQTVFDKKFDLIFSNFGGLNGVNPESLRKLLAKLPAILNPGGRFVGVVMPKYCAWEMLHFLIRFKIRKAFRRITSKEVTQQIDGVDCKTWYYQPRQVVRWSKEKFRVVSLKPLGFVLPPAQVKNFFSVRGRLLLKLNNFEKNFFTGSLLSGFSDHFMIDLQLRSE